MELEMLLQEDLENVKKSFDMLFLVIMGNLVLCESLNSNLMCLITIYNSCFFSISMCFLLLLQY